MKSRYSHISVLFGVVTALVASGVLLATLNVSAMSTPESAVTAPVEQPPPPGTSGSTTPDIISKIHPDLRHLVHDAGPALPGRQVQRTAQEPAFVRVIATAPAEQLDLAGYFVDGNFAARRPLIKGDLVSQSIYGRVTGEQLIKLAALHEIDVILPVVLEQNAYPDVQPIDDERTEPELTVEDWAQLRAGADELRAGVQDWSQARAFGDGRADAQPRDWFEVMPSGPHKAEVAWDRGYRGDGVTVAVLDDGIDPAHPDLIGTQEIYSSTVNAHYNGWPVVFSPLSQFLYFLDVSLGANYVESGYPSIHYVDTSTTPAVTPCGANSSCFTYTPLIDYGTINPFAQSEGGYTYVISDSMTSSGVVHVGTHPDNDIRDYLWGEKPAVLVTDPNVPEVYDTVYIDLDNDYDFRDEKPLTKADVNDPGTYNSMIAYRDINDDGLADISGGMLYFIANGQHNIPGFDWMWGNAPPANGSLIALSGSTFDRAYSHGTQCASNIVGQGQTSWLLPMFSDLPGDGVPSGAVFGMAPEAKIVNISDIYYDFLNSTIDGYYFSAIGYDGIDQTGFSVYDGSTGNTDTDAIQITSNSYGDSAGDNDGWDYQGQIVSQILNDWAPYQQAVFSTGNGGSAYGTVAPPSSAEAIGVGASTQFGSTGWDSITSTTQIMHNDVTPFSNRGPGARGTTGADVVAGGAFAAGAEELNYFSVSFWGAPDGNKSWLSWGGTSRSAPVSAGLLALIYDAFHENTGMWPTHQQAKALVMSTATDINYDVFSQGAGSVNADRATAVAAGEYGVYVTDPIWEPGDFRGQNYPGFAHLVEPGEIHTNTFTVHNPGSTPITVNLDDAELTRIDSQEFDFTITPAMVEGELAYGPENRDNFYKAFHYFIPITAQADKISQNASWDNIEVPANTDLMVVRQVQDLDNLDPDGDYEWDNRFYLAVYNWMDQDNDGRVWEDKNGNGVVNIINAEEISLIDLGTDLQWSHEDNELDQHEFGRFSYHRPVGNRAEMWVHNPLERMHDGLFIGLRHHPDSAYTDTTTLSYRIDFYEKADTGWLEVNQSSLNVPAGGSANFVATANVPPDIPTGAYQAAIQIEDPGMDDPERSAAAFAPHTTVVPVVLNVAAEFENGLQLAGTDSYTYDQNRPYNNGAVRGIFDWGWRPESGDWRFFFMDVDNRGEFTATLQPENEVPPVTGSSASGNATFTLDATTGRLSYQLNFTGITTPTMAHIHRGEADENGPVAYWLYDASGSNATASVPAVGTVQLSQADVARLLDEGLYVNVHSEDHPSGEVRGQTIRTDSGDLLTGNAQMLVRNDWNGQSPGTDIDNVVLGPTPSPMGDYWLSYPDSSYFGPYILDKVASSPNTNASAGIWIFDTSSGGSEDWIAAPLQDGLHEILAHNVLYQGDRLDVVFTTTLGTLQSTDQVVIETYEDTFDGNVPVEVTSGLSLSGLEVDAFGLGAPEGFEDVPIDFVNSNTIEFTQPFVVEHGAKIVASTSSDNISDVDLYLFYCGPEGDNCSQQAASTTATASERVEALMPADGVWVIGVNNWSGPAGTFDLTRNVVQGHDLSVDNVPSGGISAQEPVSFTVGVTAILEAGTQYEGLILAGPPDAPALLQIPVRVDRVAPLTMSTPEETFFPGSEFVLTYRLENVTDTPTTFSLQNPLPEGLEFVSIEGGEFEPGSSGTAAIDATNDMVSFSGVVTDAVTIDVTLRVAPDVEPGSTITNTAQVSAEGLFEGTQEQTITFQIEEGGAFGTSSMTATETAATGSEIVYSVVVSNTGNTLVDVTVTGAVPQNTTFDAVDNEPPVQSFTYNSGEDRVEWTGMIAPGDSRTFTWHVTVDEDPALWGETITGGATITWNGEEVNLSAGTDVHAPNRLIFPAIYR